MSLTPAQHAEIETLARRYGEPRRLSVPIRTFFDPVQRPDRFAEVCMVVRRTSGRVLLSIKTFYPRGAYRLPTGGIHHEESIGGALLRETKEETGLDTEVRRFLAAIDYHDALQPEGPPIFHTFAFLLDETGGTFETLDTDEQIEDWVEVDPATLGEVAAKLASIPSKHSDEIGGDWADWGRFRAVVHRVVYEALRTSRTGRAAPRG